MAKFMGSKQKVTYFIYGIVSVFIMRLIYEILTIFTVN